MHGIENESIVELPLLNTLPEPGRYGLTYGQYLVSSHLGILIGSSMTAQPFNSILLMPLGVMSRSAIY